MFLIGGLNGKLKEYHGEVTVGWTIPDFRFLPQKEHYCHQSPIFTFAGLRWSLQVFPGGYNIENDTTKWVSVYIKCHRILEVVQPDSVEYKLGIKKNDGAVEFLVDKSYNFSKSECGAGSQRFYKRTDMVKRKKEYLPADELTIVCVLKHSSAKIVQETAELVKFIELERLSKDFKDLYTCKKSCDAIVRVKDREFQVHKSILIARSPVFASMFEHDMEEKKTGVVSIVDCDPDSFGDFLLYLYTGKVQNISFRTALNLYCTADKYDIKKLKAFCVAFMIRHLSVENVCELVALGDQYDESEILWAAQVFFNKNWSQILSTAKWEALMQENCILANKLLKEMANNFHLLAEEMKNC